MYRAKHLSAIPFYNTKISPADSRADIEKLLEKYGITDRRWTDYEGKTQLEMIVRITKDNQQREITLLFKPPVILISRRTYNEEQGKYEKKNIPHKAMAMRLLYWYLDAKLKAVYYGLETIEKEFLSQVNLTLPNGQQTTIGAVIENLIEDPGRLLENKATPFKGEEDAPIIDITD